MIIASPQLDHLAMIDPALSPLNGTLYGDRGAFTALLDSLSKLPEPQDGSYGVRQAKDTLSNPQDKTRESVPVPQSGDEAREAGKARTGSADETPATGRFPGNEPRKAQRNVQKDPAAGKEAAEAALRDQLRGENPETGDKESGLETASVAVLAGALAAAEEPLMSGVESGTEISGAGLSLENSAPVVAGQAPRAGTGPGGTEGGTVSQDTAAQAGTTLNMAAGVQTAEASDTAEVVQSGLNAVARAAAEPGLESGQETVPKPATEKTGRKLRAGASAQMAAGESATVKSNRQAAPRRETEGEGSGDKTGADTRTRDKRRERLAVEIRDQRTQIDPNRNQPSEALARSNGQVGTEITVDLRAQANSRADSSAPGAGPQEGNFQDMLARELHENLNTDIVRHASIILRDGGEGIIRLNLKPEALGNVKIRLEMTENKIAGQIIVESDEALKAFEQEIRALEQAFRDSGFDGASIEMAVSRDGGENGAGRQWQEGEASPFFSERLAATNYDNASDILENEFLGDFIPGLGSGLLGDYIPVNMLV